MGAGIVCMYSIGTSDFDAQGGVLLVHNEVLVRNVIHYVPVLLPSHHLQVHIYFTMYQ